MELAELIEHLSDPAAYPHPVEAVEVRRTHISVVFLAGDYVYKIKKPVSFGFIDYSTPGKRKNYCNIEVRENESLAPGIYLGVEPVRSRAGKVGFHAEGRTVEHAVKMRRLPDDAHLRARLARGEDVRPILDRLIDVLLAGYGRVEIRPKFDPTRIIARFALENFGLPSKVTKGALAPSLEKSLARMTRQRIEELEPLLRLRASTFVRRTHGDLRLDHVYQVDETSHPIVIDCVEFDDALRVTDIVADIAFLAMELITVGRRDLSDYLIDRYAFKSSDTTCRRLFPFFISYRSAVRAKVRGLTAASKEAPESLRRDSIERAKGHWLLAHGEIAPPASRPALVMVGGLPGTGKSTFARKLAATADFEVIRSDQVRKELAGVSGQTAGAEFGGGIYTPDWTERTYAECLRRAEEFLLKGRRVIIDATFGRASHRNAAFDLATRLCVRSTFFVCVAAPEVVRDRLLARVNDVSDADFKIHEQAAKAWEPVDARALVVDGSEASDRGVIEHLDGIGLI